MATTSDLIETLRRTGRTGGSDLARILGVSPATLSRLVRAAGEDVCRIGKRRGATYALRRAIRGLPRALPVFRVDREGAIARLGTLHPLADGGHWLEREEGPGVLYEGAPPFVADMQPQGLLGAPFARFHPDLELPPRLQDWNDDHRLIALARRGEDCVGNLLVGEESLQRFWTDAESGVSPVPDSAYPEYAQHAADRPAGSSIGGEGPKFLAFSETTGQHVLVKFTSGRDDAGERRWRDLLACEAIALETLGDREIAVPDVRILDVGARRFLEVTRFDRRGERGRIGVVSMSAWDAEHLGLGTNWTTIAKGMARQRALSDHDLDRIRWLDAFGALIGNTDRHAGNITFYAPDPGDRTARLSLAPVYDMLPMCLAPAEARIRPSDYAPKPPDGDHLDVWPDAAAAAEDFWDRVTRDARVSAAFQSAAVSSREALARIRGRVAPS